MFDEEQDNYCEGCMVRNTGDNFAHAGLCRLCMSQLAAAADDEVLKGKEALMVRPRALDVPPTCELQLIPAVRGLLNQARLATAADAKEGPLRTWRDTDAAEVSRGSDSSRNCTPSHSRSPSPTRSLSASRLASRRSRYCSPSHPTSPPPTSSCARRQRPCT